MKASCEEGLMRAIWLREFGGPEVLTPGTAPDPVPDAGQVLVDVSLVNITFVETQVRAGRGPFPVSLPMIPGNGVGGVVVAAGEGVGPGLVGTRVVTSTGGTGAYAERVAVPADGLFALPDERNLEEAVALLADGRTATMMMRAAGVRPGERVLVEAAAGGVGSLLVQLATAAGAEVVGAAGGTRKTKTVTEMGVGLSVDYGVDGWGAGVGAVDVVFDGVGGEIGRVAFDLLKPGGRMVSFGLASGTWVSIDEEEARQRGVSLVKPHASAIEMREFTQAALSGSLKPLIGQRFPLARAADAHAAIESRQTIGKTLLEVR